ncbi:MAG: signal recognition particle-docking protein FtsY [Pseudomonas sp.]
MRKKPQVAAAPAVDPASVSASPVASAGTDAPAVSAPPATTLPASGVLEAPATETAAVAAPVAPALSDAAPSKPAPGEVAVVAATAPEAAPSTAPPALGASAAPLAASELAAAKTAAIDNLSVATPSAAPADGSPASSAAITVGNAGSAAVTGDVPDGAQVTRDTALPDAALSPAGAIAEPSKLGFFSRLKQGLAKTSASLGEGMASLFLGSKIIDDDLFDEIETRLLTADVGVEATNQIIQSLTQRVARKQLTDSGALYKALQEELTALLRPVEKPLVIDAAHSPFVILVVGVNGAGKTTTIGKLAKKLQLDGKKVMLAAGDTFRAAAVEQLQVWGERNQIAVIAQHTGADSASVIFDAVQAAKSRGMDVLIADTAGRLHTKDNLMEELKKVRRVIGKLDPAAPHEVLLVLDAGTGQNAISQTKQFNQTVNLTGLALTKLDGTAKGGVIFALAKQFGLPIRYIGMGEGIDDLRTFEAEPFVQALFAEREQS